MLIIKTWKLVIYRFLTVYDIHMEVMTSLNVYAYSTLTLLYGARLWVRNSHVVAFRRFDSIEFHHSTKINT